MKGKRGHFLVHFIHRTFILEISIEKSKSVNDHTCTGPCQLKKSAGNFLKGAGFNPAFRN